MLGCLGLLCAAPLAAASATITGEVTSAVPGEVGKKVADLEVIAYEATSGDPLEQTAKTGPLGTYVLTLPNGGDYLVGFRQGVGTADDYAPQYYPEKTHLAEAAAVDVLEGAVKGSINARLTKGASISGTVTNADTHQPLAGILTYALSGGLTEPSGALAVTNTAGEYTLAGLPTGSTQVAFLSEGSGVVEGAYISQIYNDEPFPEKDFGLEALRLFGTPIPVAAPNTTSGIDASLLPTVPVNTVAPVASGTPAVGHPLSCAAGTWTGLGTLTYTHQWLREGSAITGATGSTYVVQAADEGHGISCEETATNKIGSVTSTSNTLTVTPTTVPNSLADIPPASPVPALTLRTSKITVSGSAARVQASCAYALCSGSIELTERVAVKQRKGNKGGSKFKTVILGKGSYSLAAGHSATLTVHLTTAARNALAKAKYHVITAILAASVTRGSSVKKKVTLTLKLGR